MASQCAAYNFNGPHINGVQAYASFSYHWYPPDGLTNETFSCHMPYQDIEMLYAQKKLIVELI